MNEEYEAATMAVAETLVRVNVEMDGPFIPPTAISWLAPKIARAVLKVLEELNRKKQ